MITRRRVMHGLRGRSVRARRGALECDARRRDRYEIRREFAPYIGVHWVRRFGDTADLNGDDRSDTRFVAGVRVWF